MQAEIIRGDDLKREVWRFEIRVDGTDIRIDLQCYDVTTQQDGEWRGRNWSRSSYMSRYNSLNTPPLPPDVVQEAKDTFKDQIDKLEVTR